MTGLLRLLALAPPATALGFLLHVALQQIPGVPTDVLAYGTPGVLMLFTWGFIQEWIATGKAVKRERARGDRLEQALLKVATKAMSATEALATVSAPPGSTDE